MNKIKVYVAGRMHKHSHYSSHTWRDDFLKELAEKTGLSFISYDPTRATKDYTDLETVFGSDVHMISEVDLVIIYASDDLSIGGSQEILIAKYLKKPVVSFAPYGGNFNETTKEIAGSTIHNYKHPFLFTTSDVVCGTMEELANTLTGLDEIKAKEIDLIDKAKTKFEAQHSKNKLYEIHDING